ncbi:acyltransferase family-domain-containing protein [Xylaria sp. FL1042]|nr:acyltransferase family-domain-containing protein [Xylaria sp. FL1042]
MKILQVFQQLWWQRKADNSGNYHLLQNEADYLEKEEDRESSVSSVESQAPRAGKHITRKRIPAFRCLRILKVLIPSFLRSSTAPVEPKRQRPTAWLDGLRGIAAFFVVLHHMSLIWFSWDIHNGWTDWNDHLIQFPIIRLAISGKANVMLFFVISGYALSWKPLNLIQNDEHLKMYQTLASSIFRRHPRLFIPATIICAPAPVIAYLGGFSGQGMPGAAIKPTNPPRFETIWGQLENYAASLMPLSDFYGPGPIPWIYSDSLWTFPVEFKSSLVVFSLLLALSRCKTRSRVVITLCVALYSFWYLHWGEFLFVGGMLVVELNHRSRRSTGAREPELDEDEHDVEVWRSRSLWLISLRTKILHRLCSIAVFLTTLFVLSLPEHDRHASDSYGYKTLVHLIPAHFHDMGAADYFWQPIAAVFLVLVIDNTRFLQCMFTTRLAQYLGRVSFALYLVHMFILHSLGFWLGKYFLRLTGSDSPWKYGTGISLAAITVGFIIMWAADLGSRFVDANAVRFTVWAYGKLCKTTGDS